MSSRHAREQRGCLLLLEEAFRHSNGNDYGVQGRELEMHPCCSLRPSHLLHSHWDRWRWRRGIFKLAPSVLWRRQKGGINARLFGRLGTSGRGALNEAGAYRSLVMRDSQTISYWDNLRYGTCGWNACLTGRTLSNLLCFNDTLSNWNSGG